MTVLKWIAAAALVFSASACGYSNTAYRGDYAYTPGAYDYNQQPTYYQTHYVTGQPTYSGYGYQPQPAYYGYQQQTYYGR